MSKFDNDERSGPAPVRVLVWAAEPGMSTRRVEDVHGTTWQRVGTGWGVVGLSIRPSQARSWESLDGPVFAGGTHQKLRDAADKEHTRPGTSRLDQAIAEADAAQARLREVMDRTRDQERTR